MSTSKESTTESPTSDADVIMNRINVTLARSQRLINSWLPPKPNTEEQTQNGAEDSDENFKPMTETGGIGSKAAYPDEGLPNGALQRKKLSSNDKLLEQLIGKKAAQARKKSQQGGKNTGGGGHAAAKPLVERSKLEQRREVESEDEEEGGRAAAFKSRKAGKVQKQTQSNNMDEGPKLDHRANVNGANAGWKLMQEKGSSLPVDSESDERPAKRKRSRYLDEVLARKANKKRRRKDQS